MGKSHKLRSEKQHTDVSLLRGGMIGQILKETSTRFTVEPSIDTPTVWITDTITGKQTQVPIFAARATVCALNDLFPQ
jgi:hypothetical protein